VTPPVLHFLHPCTVLGVGLGLDLLFPFSRSAHAGIPQITLRRAHAIHCVHEPLLAGQPSIVQPIGVDGPVNLGGLISPCSGSCCGSAKRGASNQLAPAGPALALSLVWWTLPLRVEQSARQIWCAHRPSELGRSSSRRWIFDLWWDAVMGAFGQGRASSGASRSAPDINLPIREVRRRRDFVAVVRLAVDGGPRPPGTQPVIARDGGLCWGLGVDAAFDILAQTGMSSWRRLRVPPAMRSWPRSRSTPSPFR